VVDNPFF
jgi:WD40 repeat protein